MIYKTIPNVWVPFIHHLNGDMGNGGGKLKVENKCFCEIQKIGSLVETEKSSEKGIIFTF